jgi:hypothetical protein
MRSEVIPSSRAFRSSICAAAGLRSSRYESPRRYRASRSFGACHGRCAAGSRGALASVPLLVAGQTRGNYVHACRFEQPSPTDLPLQPLLPEPPLETPGRRKTQLRCARRQAGWLSATA